jgi:hypothetical protein
MTTGLHIERVYTIARALLRTAPDRVEAYEPDIGGDDSHSYQVCLDGRPMMLKIKKRPGTPVGVYFHSRLRQAGIPVPELIAFDPQAGPNGEACAIWSWVEGKPAHWQAGQSCPYDEAEFGQWLRQIHDLRFDGPFGLLGDDLEARTFSSHPDLGPVSDRWLDFFHWDRAARRYYDLGYLDRQEAEKLGRLAHKLAPLFSGTTACLLHMGDVMHHGNMIVGADGRIAAIVDFVESTAGDPRWELAWVDFYFSVYPFERPSFDMARFRSGYGTDHDPCDQVGQFYTLAILVFEKLLFYRPDSRRGAWAIAKVKQVLKGI